MSGQYTRGVGKMTKTVNEPHANRKEKPVLLGNPKGDETRDGDRERVYKQRKKFEGSESKLSDEERLLFGVLDSSCKEAS